MNKFFVLWLFILQLASLAYANCSSPAGVSGTVTWNGTLSEVQYCDGSAWLSAKYGRITLRATLTDPATTIIDTPNTAHALSGNNAFIVSGNTLFVLDATTITNVTASAQATFTELAGASRAVVDGNYLYVTATNSLRIFDISIPTSPTLVGSLVDATNLSAATKKIVIVGNYAYVLSGTRVVVINITTKSSPTLTGSIVVANAQGIAADVSYVYLSRSDTGLSVVDMTTPSSPTVVGTLTHANIYNGRGIAVSGNYVYTVGTNGGSTGAVTTIDVTTRTAPTYVSATINTNNLEGVTDIFKFGSYLYTIQSNGRNAANYVNLYSLSSPASITMSSNSALAGVTGANCAKISLSSTRVLCTQSFESTSHFFNSSAQNGNIGTDNLVTFSNKLGGAMDVVVSGTTAYIAATSSRLTTANISSPTSPTLLGSVFDGNMSAATGVAVDGTSAYVITSNSGYSLVQLNVSNPAAPAFVSSTNNFFANSSSYKIRVRGGVRYWTGSGMTRFSNSAGAQVNIGTAPYGFAFSNSADYAYVCLSSTSTLSVFSVSAPASMVSVGSVSDTSLAGCRGVESAGNYLFVSSTTAPSNLSVWDITVPTAPVKVGAVLNTNIATYRDMKVVGNNVYVITSSRLTLFDVTTKSAPFLLDTATITSGSWGFSVVGNYVYVANNTNNKLEVYEVIPPINMGNCSKNGEFIYDFSTHAYKYCTNTNYLSMGPVGAGGAGCSSPTGKTGELRFNTATSKLRYCNGAIWTNVGLD